MTLLEKLLQQTNRTDHDIKRAIESGTFEVKASYWNDFVKDEGWYIDEESGEYYPTFEELRKDKKLADSLDLEIVSYEGQQYVLVIVH